MPQHSCNSSYLIKIVKGFQGKHGWVDEWLDSSLKSKCFVRPLLQIHFILKTYLVFNFAFLTNNQIFLELVLTFLSVKLNCISFLHNWQWWINLSFFLQRMEIDSSEWWHNFFRNLSPLFYNIFCWISMWKNDNLSIVEMCGHILWEKIKVQSWIVNK